MPSGSNVSHSPLGGLANHSAIWFWYWFQYTPVPAVLELDVPIPIEGISALAPGTATPFAFTCGSLLSPSMSSSKVGLCCRTQADHERNSPSTLLLHSRVSFNFCFPPLLPAPVFSGDYESLVSVIDGTVCSTSSEDLCGFGVFLLFTGESSGEPKPSEPTTQLEDFGSWSCRDSAPPSREPLLPRTLSPAELTGVAKAD